MSYNGSGTFQINTSGQPVVAGTVISSTAFNALTADLATGLSTAITKDGQTTTTARIPFAQGINSSLATDSSSTSTGSIITAGGVGIAKNLYVGANTNIAGTLDVTGAVTVTNPVINNIKMGYTTTATAAGSTTLTVSSNYRQFFTGTLAQTIVLPVTSTLVTGMAFEIENNSTGLLTVNSSGGNLVGTIPAGVCAHAVCIGTTLTTAADWDWDYISTTTITGTGANVLGTSPTITTPTISSLSSAAATALTLQSAGSTAITVDTSQNVGIGTASPTAKLEVVGSATATRSTSGQLSLKRNATTSYSGIQFPTGTAKAAFFGTPPSSDDLTFGFDAGSSLSEAMRIDSSGNVGIGQSSITQAFGGYTQLNISGSSGATIQMQSGATNRANIIADGNGLYVASLTGYTVFSTGGTGTGTERMRIDSSGNVLVTSVAGLGYGTGSGGTVTQATSKSTGVTLNKPTGQITMSNAALGAGATATFRMDNSLLSAQDVLTVSLAAADASATSYQTWVNYTSGGAAYISLKNVSGGSRSEAIIINFALIKVATS